MTRVTRRKRNRFQRGSEQARRANPAMKKMRKRIRHPRRKSGSKRRPPRKRNRPRPVRSTRVSIWRWTRNWLCTCSLPKVNDGNADENVSPQPQPVGPLTNIQFSAMVSMHQFRLLVYFCVWLIYRRYTVGEKKD